MRALGRELKVVRIVILSADDDEVFDATSNVKLVAIEKSQVAGAKVGTITIRQLRLERFSRFYRAVPVSRSDAWTFHPNFANATSRNRLASGGVDHANVEV